MNTTHSIFNERQINCTILGGLHPDKKPVLNVSVILLNSGNAHLRAQNLENLTNCGFEKIISLENDSNNYSLEDNLQKFPHVKFIIPLEKVADGDLVNLAVSEITSPYFLVLRNSLNITSQILNASLAKKLGDANVFCLIPRILSKGAQGVPIQFIPAVKKSVLKIDSSTQVTDGLPTLFPFKFLGFYNTKKFNALGGYDTSIRNSYWQNLDLSFRAWLWGEQVKISTSFQISYSDEIPPEDSTPDLSQLRFFLKNMAPVYKYDHAELPFSKFWGFKMNSSCGLFETIRQFNEARFWVRSNRSQFKLDAFKLISEWGKI